MNQEQVNQFLNEISQQYNLLDITVDGWSVWPVIRLYAGQRLLNRTWDGRDKKVAVFSNRQKADFILKHFRPIFFLPQTNLVSKTFTSALRGSAGDRFKDIFVDDLLDSLNEGDYLKIGTLELHANVQTYLELSQNPYIPENANSYPLEAVASGLSRLYVPKKVKTVAREFSAVLTQIPELNRFSKKECRRLLGIYFWTKRLYSRVLHRIRPKQVLIANHSKYAFTAAARESGAVVYELQHGSPNCQKLPYSWSKADAAYKKQLPLPNKILLFGDHFGEALSKNNFWTDELVSVGSMRFDAKREPSQLKSAEPFTILVTTQGLSADKICDFIKELLGLAVEKLACRVIIKLHPNYDSNQAIYKKSLADFETVTIYKNSEGPDLYELFFQANLHLSIYSTTHFESLALGVPTYIFPFQGHEQMSVLVERQHAKIAHSPEFLFQEIQTKSFPLITSAVSNTYFKAKALENIRKELQL